MSNKVKSRLLVVDDNEANRDVLSRRLERAGFAVDMAIDGEQALEMIEAQTFDLILLDMMMPGLSGLEVLEQLRKSHSASALPVIIVTAQKGRKSVLEALDHGANDHIAKPVDYGILMARVETQLGRKRAEAKLAEANLLLEEANLCLEERVKERTEELGQSNEALKGEIAAREKAQVALIASQERTNAILNFTLNTIIVTDTDCNIEFINRAGEMKFGLSFLKSLGTNMASLFATDMPLLGGKKSTGDGDLVKGISFEAEAVHLGGTTFPAEIVVREMQNDDNLSLLWVIFDATERKEAEQKLRASEARHRRLIERLPVPLFVHANGKILFANQNAAEMAGARDVAELMDSDAMGFVHPDDWKALIELHEESRKKDAPQRYLEHRNLRIDGIEYWCESALTALEWDGRPATMVLARDITDRKETEDRFRLLASNATGLVTWRSLEGEYLYVSSSIERLLGYTQHEFTTLDFADFVHPDDTAQPFSEYKKELLETKQSKTFTRRLKAKSGEYRCFESIAQLVRDDEGNISGIVTASRDITEHRLAEEEKNALEKQMRQSQKIESLGTLAGGIAHEFNNILMVVSGYISRALKDQALSGETRGNLDEAGDAATRAASITKKLLVFSGKHAQETGVIDIGELLKDTESMLVPLIGEEVMLMLDINRGSLRIKADADQLQQAIVNLVINARHAMGGSGWISLGAKKVELTENLETADGGIAKPGKYVALYVEDQGCGMDDELIGKIFDPFFTTKGPGGGTGLGLAVIYGFMQESGGVIDVQSTIGEGTHFTLYFPLSEEEISERRIVDDSVPKGTGELVMIVEDEEALRTLLVGDLESLGYEIVSAGDGIEAMELESELEKPIELLLSDVRMPGFSGPETAAALSATQPEMKIIFMSGYAPDDDEGRTQIPEGAPFIAKPVDLATLANKMREALDG